MKLRELNNEQQLLVISAIANYGTNEHPIPTLENLEFFTDTYAKQCLNLAVNACKDCDMGSVIDKVEMARDVLKLMNKS